MRTNLSLIYLLIVLLAGISCTTTRWVVTDEASIDNGVEPVLVSVKNILLLEREPSYTNPVITYSAYQVIGREYVQRIELERTVQQYRPRWGFLTLGLSASAFALIAANTSMVSTSIGTSQKIALNTAAGLLAVASIINMKPVGEPIYTGENQLMRQSGTVVISDTTAHLNRNIDLDADLRIVFREDTIFSESGLQLTDGNLDISLVPVVSLLSDEIDEESTVGLLVTYNGESTLHEIVLSSFLEPHITITDPIAVLRSVPILSEVNVITEVGQGSLLRLIREEGDWYRVQFGGSEVFISESSGQKVWKSEVTSQAANIFEFGEVPFGEIDVESGVPILKQNNPNDRAIVLTNGYSTQMEPRQYLDRDHELFTFYMRSALQMNRNQISVIEMDPDGNWIDEFEQFSSFDSTASLFVYLTGFAYQTGLSELRLLNIEDDVSPPILSSFIFDKFEQMNPNSLFFIADIEFSQELNGSAIGRVGSSQVLLETANHLTRRLPNSVLLFSSRPGQKSSIYAAEGFMNQRHHIFNYYLAEAIKRRNTRMSDIIRYLENNVDYTSRRLHDRSQDIQAFGNTTLRINE